MPFYMFYMGIFYLTRTIEYPTETRRHIRLRLPPPATRRRPPGSSSLKVAPGSVGPRGGWFIVGLDALLIEHLHQPSADGNIEKT